MKRRRVSIYVNELEMVSRDRTSVYTHTHTDTYTHTHTHTLARARVPKKTKTTSSRKQHVVLFINIKEDKFLQVKLRNNLLYFRNRKKEASQLFPSRGYSCYDSPKFSVVIHTRTNHFFHSAELSNSVTAFRHSMGRLEQLKSHGRHTTENTTQKTGMQSCVLSCGHLNTDSSITHALIT